MITLLKVIFSAGLLLLLFGMVDFRAIGQLIAHATWVYIGWAMVFQWISTVLAAYRWSLIMESLAFHEPFRFYLSSYFKGAFFNQALPGSIGGDAVRGLELGAMGYRKKEAFFGIFLDRIVGLAGLLVLNLGANLLHGDLLPPWLFHLITMICVGGIGAFGVLITLRKIAWLQHYRVTRVFADLSSRFRQVYHTQQAIVVQLGLSVLIHLFSILAVYALAQALGVIFPLSTFLVAVPPVFLLTIIPLSLAGWGVRESALVGIFLLLGASKEGILSVSLLYGLVLIVTSLPGLGIWVRGKKIV
jgi:hypothetical protein